MMCGGFNQANPATPEIQQLADKFKDPVGLALGRQFTEFTAVSYTTQVVAGTNYKIKVKTDTDHVHIKVFKPLPCNGTEEELTEYTGGHNAETAL